MFKHVQLATSVQNKDIINNRTATGHGSRVKICRGGGGGGGLRRGYGWWVGPPSTIRSNSH